MNKFSLKCIFLLLMILITLLSVRGQTDEAELCNYYRSCFFDDSVFLLQMTHEDSLNSLQYLNKRKVAGNGMMPVLKYIPSVKYHLCRFDTAAYFNILHLWHHDRENYFRHFKINYNYLLHILSSDATVYGHLVKRDLHTDTCYLQLVTYHIYVDSVLFNYGYFNVQEGDIVLMKSINGGGDCEFLRKNPEKFLMMDYAINDTNIFFLRRFPYLQSMQNPDPRFQDKFCYNAFRPYIGDDSLGYKLMQENSDSVYYSLENLKEMIQKR